jgi:hypothetical protein
MAKDIHPLSQRTRRLGVAEADGQNLRAGGAAFLQRVDALKQRHGGGISDFEPARLDLVPAEPFARKTTE